MSWTVLINTNPGHNKFWSYNGAQRCWGRIGTNGRCETYSELANEQKAQDKIIEGYITFSHNYPSPSPTPSEVQQRRYGGIIPPGNVTAAQESREVRQTQQIQRNTISENLQGIPVPTYNRSHIIPSVEQYRTDNKGYIIYREGYNRNNIFNEYFSSLVVINIREIIEQPNSREFTEAKKYFNRIQANSQYNKPERFERLKESQRPTYASVFYKKGRILECIAIYGVNRNQKYCDFLAIKSNIPQRTTVLKLILSKISNIVNDTIIFRLANNTMKEDIMDIAPFYTENTSNTIKYNIIDLQNGIPLPQARPLRWIK